MTNDEDSPEDRERKRQETVDLLRAMQLEAEQREAEAAENVAENMRLFELSACRRVQELREAKGWSQADLSAELAKRGLHMHQTTVAKLERGKRPLRVSELATIALVFGLPPVAMFSVQVPGDQPYGVEYIRDALATAERNKQEALETAMSVIDTLMTSYGHFEADRRIFSELLGKAIKLGPEPIARDDDGDDQETE